MKKGSGRVVGVGVVATVTEVEEDGGREGGEEEEEGEDDLSRKELYMLQKVSNK